MLLCFHYITPLYLLYFIQWAGEVISREKTTVHEEFLDLEKDIELRRDGVNRSVVWVPYYYIVISEHALTIENSDYLWLQKAIIIFYLRRKPVTP